jgi:hypothetical protein
MEFIKNIMCKLKSNSFEGYVQNFRLWHWTFLLKERREAFMLGFEHNPRIRDRIVHLTMSISEII